MLAVKRQALLHCRHTDSWASKRGLHRSAAVQKQCDVKNGHYHLKKGRKTLEGSFMTVNRVAVNI